MSISISIDCKVDNIIEIKACLQCFMKQEWSLLFDGEICYLPLADSDMYNWSTATEPDIDRVFDELHSKQKASEVIGIVVVDKHTSCGGELLIWSDYFSFSLTFTINKSNMREVDYYIHRLKESIQMCDLQLICTEVGSL